MKKILFVGAVALALAGCTSPNNTERVLREQGYTEIKLTGYRFFMCGEHDTFSTGFEAKSPSGSKVSGAVCSGWFKGATIRLD